MILPIRLFGDEILRTPAAEVGGNSDELRALIDDMIETMHGASGIGLAAPQVGESLRLFVVDMLQGPEPQDEQDTARLEMFGEGPVALINPEILVEGGRLVGYEEGCLSLPEIREEVVRPDIIRIRFLDREFNQHDVEVDDILARVLQHELDHLEGILFIDHLTAFRRRLLRRRLREISRGRVHAEYPTVTADAESPASVRKRDQL